MPHDSPRVLVTGANGHLGHKLVERLLREGERPVRALVRSERAAETLRTDPGTSAAEIVVADYTDEAAMNAAVSGTGAVAHLVGIIKESASASYEQAHEATCRILARAASAGGVERIVYLSIIGARPDHSNGCLGSKGRAEEILLGGSVPTTVLRVPMVIGEGDFAALSLRRQASSSIAPLVGGGRTRQQPIDAQDVLGAVLAAFARSGTGGLALDMGGPENLSHRELVARAAAVLGRPPPRVLPIPRALVAALAWLMERTSSSPGITRDMLEILEHDDRIEARVAFELLGIEPTPLDETLARCIAGAGRDDHSKKEDAA